VRIPAISAHARAIDEDNLRRIRWVGLALPLLNLVYMVLLQPADDSTPQVLLWQQTLQRLHLAMALVFTLVGLGAHGLLRLPSAPPLLRRIWPPLTAALALGFTLAFAATDQLVGGNIAAFLLGCVITAVLVVMHPLVSALLYAAVLAGFWIALGALQRDPVALLANQLNGSSGAALGWMLSALTWRQQLQYKALLQRLQQSATTDDLTGLANRAETVRLVNEELARGLRYGQPTSVLLLDLDHFKQVNDRLGHPGGDRVLQHAALALTQTVRTHDRVGRLGGEEFLVLLPQTDAAAAAHLAERLRLHVAQALQEFGGVTCSIGLVTTGARDASGFDPLYLQADQALYRAKRAGRNCCAAAL